MRNQKTLHFCHQEKFISDFIEFIGEHFDKRQHDFWVFGGDAKYSVPKPVNVKVANVNKFLKVKDYLFLIVAMCRAKKIIVHGLFNPVLIRILCCMPWLLKKCYWVMWGGDFYIHQAAVKGWGWHKNEFFRHLVIKKMGHLVTGTPGDVELVRKWYGAKGEHIRCFNYPSNIYKPYDIGEKKHSTINIQIGNSADPSNFHFEILEKLVRYKKDDIKLFAPLSYGDKEYAEKVIEKGKGVFGDKFYPLTEMLPFEQYLEFLAEIDIAVFNHRRQQAFGNTITLLGLGKKVYLNLESTLNGVFKEFDIKIFDINKIDIELLDKQARFSNIEKVKTAFSEESLVKSLKEWIE